MTRAELQEELAKYPTREELRETLRSELASYATKQDLEAWGHTLHAHLQASLQASLYSSLSRKLESEIARFAKAIEESNRALFRALDDKYKDLPGRVAALEDRDRQP